MRRRRERRRAQRRKPQIPSKRQNDVERAAAILNLIAAILNLVTEIIKR